MHDVSRFLADERERELRRREAPIGFVVAGVALTPAALVLLWSAVAALAGDESWQWLLWTALGLVFNPFVLLVVGLSLFKSISTLVGRTTVVVLEPAHLSVPGQGARGVYAVGLEDGYRYTPSKRVLQVRVPYGRVRDVRRVTDPAEIDSLEPRGLHRTTRATAGGLVLRQTVRGHALVGPGAEAGAPALLDEELRTCWVTDPDAAVAIELHELRLASTMYGALPAHLVRPTLYVSVEDPDTLVAELLARVAATPPLPASPPPPLPEPAPPPPPAPPPRPAPVARPARAPAPDPFRSAREWAATPLGRRVVDLGTGLVWWLAASLVGFVGVELCTTVIVMGAAGGALFVDAGIVMLFVGWAAAGAAYLVWPCLVGVVELVAVLVGFRPLWRRVVLTLVLFAGAVPTLGYVLGLADSMRPPPHLGY